MKDGQPTSGSERMLLILRLLGERREPVSPNELAKSAGLPLSTLYRQIAVLRQWGFVAETPKGLTPGPACLQLAWGFDEAGFLKIEAEPILRELAAQTGETVGLMMAIQDQVVCISMIESKQPLRCTFAQGTGLPLTAGASAKALLAAMSERSRAQVLARLANAREDLPSTEEIKELCAQVKVAGYVVTEGEVDAGVWGVSAPITTEPGRITAAITTMAPSLRAYQTVDTLIRFTSDAARRIAEKINNTFGNSDRT